MMEINPNTLIWEKPPCAKQGCKGKGFARVGTVFVCPECFIKYEQKRVAYITEQTQRTINEL